LIVLFTDFGLQGPYTGQMKAVLHQLAPGIPIVDLFADAPLGNPRPSAYLLAACAAWFPAGTTFLCVVDPGVGGARPSIILEADGRWYVGPGILLPLDVRLYIGRRHQAHGVSERRELT
jgi:S-adenosylmethionine hydrolase